MTASIIVLWAAATFGLRWQAGMGAPTNAYPLKHARPAQIGMRHHVPSVMIDRLGPLRGPLATGAYKRLCADNAHRRRGRAQETDPSRGGN